MAETGETHDEREIDTGDGISTGGGAYTEGDIHTGGGDFVGRDKYELHVEAGGIVNLPAPRVPLPPLPPAGALPPPGPLPPGSRMPHRRNAVFTGREADLLALADGLLYHPRGPLAVTAVAGAGGIGKSQLAVEFGYRYGAYLGGVHWVSCAEPGGIAAEVAACGLALGAQPWPEKTPEQVALTLRAWRADPRRLVVLDNLEDEAALREWLPALDGLPVLVTTRRSVWPPDLGLALRALDVLARAESLRLLRRLAPRLEGTPDAALDPLAARLGDLPLALDLAGRYLEEVESLAVGDFLAALSAEGLLHPALLDWTKHSPTAHAAGLAQTFELSYERLAGDDPGNRAARRIFWAAGYCAPNRPIPVEVLRVGSLAEGEEPALVDRGLRRLVELGLLSPGAEGPSIHPLLAEFARLVGEGEAFGRLADALIEAAQKAFESGLPGPYLPLRPHLEAAAEWGESEDEGRASTLMNELAMHLRQLAEYGRARALYERALAIDERVYGPEHPTVAALASNLGNLLRILGDLAGARALHERALAIDETVYGPEHPRVAIRASNLGLVLHALGDLAGARAHIARALAIDEKVYGPEHPSVASDASNLGTVLKDLGDLEGARAHIAWALAIDEKVYGPEHPEVATDASNLGLVLQDLGDLPGARALHERALAIDETIFGPEHPSVAVSANNLGMVLQGLGDLEGAKEHIARALAIDEKVYGPEHLSVATAASNLGTVLHDLGDLAGARALHERALAIDENVFGPEHPDVAIRASNLGSVLYRQGDLDGAKTQFERALAIFEKFLPEGHPNIRTVRRWLEAVEGER